MADQQKLPHTHTLFLVEESRLVVGQTLPSSSVSPPRHSHSTTISSLARCRSWLSAHLDHQRCPIARSTNPPGPRLLLALVAPHRPLMTCTLPHADRRPSQPKRSTPLLLSTIRLFSAGPPASDRLVFALHPLAPTEAPCVRLPVQSQTSHQADKAGWQLYAERAEWALEVSRNRSR